VLGGMEAGITCTVSSVLPAGSIEAGEAIPMPESSAGAGPQTVGGAPLWRGVGPKTKKTLAVIAVLKQPFPRPTTGIGLLSPAVAAVSKQLAVPYPTRSTMRPPTGHASANAAVSVTSATFPSEALRLVVPVASGGGKLVVPPAP